jgi:hypothetical protein
MITKENEMNDTQTMSDLDIIRQTAAENEGMAPDTTWAEIFSHFRRRLGVRPAELADIAEVTIASVYEVELNADHVSPLTRMTIWDALCFLESER